MQEGAVVKYSNPAYITNVHVFTVRRRRNDPYLTNITATIHTAFGNNVTVKFSYLLPSGNAIEFSTRTCDSIDKRWIYDFVATYSNLTECPVKPGTYRYFNVEIPPKNFPLPIPPGVKKGDKGNVNFQLLRYGKEVILDLFTTIRAY
ncbi:uncharacterized protein LOC134657133 [Cydia amplana]|uniref:uncharacterized protein LOC134657133 n=1 Tax=Cydia amplana TaxID=1869771 RepID=UPI002FE589C1